MKETLNDGHQHKFKPSKCGLTYVLICLWVNFYYTFCFDFMKKFGKPNLIVKFFAHAFNKEWGGICLTTNLTPLLSSFPNESTLEHTHAQQAK